jgi:hypothetical protein
MIPLSNGTVPQFPFLTQIEDGKITVARDLEAHEIRSPRNFTGFHMNLASGTKLRKDEKVEGSTGIWVYEILDGPYAGRFTQLSDDDVHF